MRFLDLDVNLVPTAIRDDERASAQTAAVASQVLGEFDVHSASVRRYARSFGLAAADCDDLLQEVFLALFSESLKRGLPVSVRGWLFRVTHNLVVQRIDRSRREPRAALEPNRIEQLVDPSIGADSALELRQHQEKWAAVVRALPQRDRACLELRAEGLRYREIARVLDMSLGSVAKSMARSLEKLHRAVGGE